jgi:DNA-binding MarR family transcriptional regulator
MPASVAIGLLLTRLGKVAARRFGGQMAEHGLRPPQFGVLNAIALDEGLSQRELVMRLGIDPSTMVAVIDGCEADGLAERRRDPLDRRRYAIHLTERGREVLDRARAAVRDSQDDLLEPLDAEERAQLEALLSRLAAREADGDAGWRPGAPAG